MSTVAERLDIRTADPANAAVRMLSEIGPVRQVRASYRRQGGCHEASFTLDAPPVWGSGELPALRRGRLVQIQDGAITLWSGRVDSTTRGSGTVEVKCVGLGQDLASYPSATAALDTAGVAVAAGVPASVNAAVDATIARGWPVTRAADFTGSVLPITIEPVQDLLDVASTALGVPWAVNAHLQLVLTPNPTSAGGIVNLTDRPVDATVPEYLTDLAAKYLDAGASSAVRYISATLGRSPRVWQTVDLTGLGALPATASTATQKSAYEILVNALIKAAPLPPAITGAFPVPAWQSIGGISLPPSRLLIQQPRLRLLGVQAPVNGTLGLPEVEISEVDWDADSDTATITPVGGTKRDIPSILSALTSPSRTDLGLR